MKVGDLVKIVRPTRVGVHAGTLGLITERHRNNFNDFWIYTVEAVAGSKIESFQATSSTIEKV